MKSRIRPVMAHDALKNPAVFPAPRNAMAENVSPQLAVELINQIGHQRPQLAVSRWLILFQEIMREEVHLVKVSAFLKKKFLWWRGLFKCPVCAGCSVVTYGLFSFYTFQILQLRNIRNNRRWLAQTGSA